MARHIVKATMIEQLHVHNVYDKIAKHFDQTRYKPWPGVEQFLLSIEPGSFVLDVGCGNGKYLGIRDDCAMYGCDPCASLVDIAQSKYPKAELVVANGLSLPYKNASMDVVISIAVLHHLSTIEARRQFLSEIKRVMRVSGLLTVWSYDAVMPSWIPMSTKGDYMVPWHNKEDGKVYERYYHVFDRDELCVLFAGINITHIVEEKQNWYIYFRAHSACA
jgi:tRNA (uracil-5-)-methyltransferase TRM9